jgi:hypothetical protein
MNSDPAPAGSAGPDEQARRSHRPTRRAVLRSAAAVGGAGAVAAVIQAARSGTPQPAAGSGPSGSAQCHLPSLVPAGQLARQPEFAKSDFFTRPLPPAAISKLVAGTEQFLGIGAAAGASGGVALDACGGAINRVAPADTAFVHRDALFLAQYTTTWTPGPRRGGVVDSGAQRQRHWQCGLHAAMRPYASGQAYQNYIDPDLTDGRQAHYGASYQRLARVKAAYDPDQVFRFPQGSTPAG